MSGTVLARRQCLLAAALLAAWCATAPAQPDSARYLVRIGSAKPRDIRSVLASPPRDAWFVEGVGAYYELRARLARKELHQKGWQQAMDEAFDRYRLDSWIGVNSIARAGDQPGHRALVTDGGLLVVACMEADMRRATDDARGLHDLLRTLFQRHDQSGRRYDTAAIFEVVTELAGDVASRPLQRMVEGTASLGLWRCATESPTR
jgi:predicted metalloprotease with PDZ domain